MLEQVLNKDFEDFFQQILQSYKGGKIALYGIGKNAEKLLSLLSNIDVLGLIALDHFGEMRYGKRIISLEQALDHPVTAIVVAATPRVTDIIVERIVKNVPRNIPVFDLWGHQRNVYVENMVIKEDLLASLQTYCHTQGDRDLLQLVSKSFFSKGDIPFVSGGRLLFQQVSQLALVFAPLTISFFSWMFKQIQEPSKAIILFSSRDGYYLYQLYQQVKNRDASLPEAIYFYTSRTAITVASIMDESDIRNVMKAIFNQASNYCVRDYLENKFGISFDHEFDMTIQEMQDSIGFSGLIDMVLERKEDILSFAERSRRKYLCYLKTLNLTEYKSIYVMDLVTKGTVVYGLGKLLNRKIHLLSFASEEAPSFYLPDMQYVHTLFGNDTEKRTLYYPFFSLFAVLELVFASNEGQLESFDEQGRPIFVSGSEYPQNLVVSIQNSISDIICCLADKNSNWYKETYSSLLGRFALELLTERYSVFDLRVEEQFTFFDPLGQQCMGNVLQRVRKIVKWE